VAGLAAALDQASEELTDEAARLWSLTDRLRTGIAGAVEGAILHGHPTWRVPHIVCFSVPGVEAEAILMALDERGFRLGTGATCPPNGVEEASHVLAAMGYLTAGTVRAGLGPGTTAEEVERLLEALPPVVGGLRRMAVASDAAMARLDDGGRDEER
jgi:cysteine desulfurase